MPKYKSIYIYIFFYYIIMEPTSQNNGINAIKEARKLFNERKVISLVKKQRELEKNSIKRKLSIIFQRKKSRKVV